MCESKPALVFSSFHSAQHKYRRWLWSCTCVACLVWYNAPDQRVIHIPYSISSCQSCCHTPFFIASNNSLKANSSEDVTIAQHQCDKNCLKWQTIIFGCVLWVLILVHVPPANMKQEGSMSFTTARHRGAIEMFCLHFWRELLCHPVNPIFQIWLIFAPNIWRVRPLSSRYCGAWQWLFGVVARIFFMRRVANKNNTE